MFKESVITKINKDNNVYKFCINLYNSIQPTYFPKFQASKKDKIIGVLYIIIQNLIIRKDTKYNYFLVSRDMSNYSPDDKDSVLNKYGFTYYNVINAIKILKQANIISEEIGHAYFIKDKEWDIWYKNKKKCQLTILKLIDPLLWKKEDLGVSFLEIAMLYCWYSNGKKSDAVIRYKKKADSRKKRIRLYQASLPSTYEKGVQKINKYFRDRGYLDLKYQRIFSCEIDDNKEITNSGYGRLYSPFQHIKKDLRNKIIEEIGYKEYDIKSCLPNILYFKEKSHKYIGDIYHDAMKSCGIAESDYSDYRDLFKKIFLIMFNVKFEKVRQSIGFLLYEYGVYETKYTSNSQKQNFQEKFNSSTKQYYFDPKYIVLNIERKFPEFKNHFFTKSSVLTQFIESQIAIEVMLCMISHNIFPITIHDAYFFPESQFDYFSSLCESIFNNVLLSNINNTSINSNEYYNYINPSYSFIQNNYFSYNKKIIFKKLLMYNIFSFYYIKLDGWTFILNNRKINNTDKRYEWNYLCHFT